MATELYLGIDGGQSHTEAVVADEFGHVLARGLGGPSNHAEQPGGRERLRQAIEQSVGNALRAIGVGAIRDVVFAAAHCAMTGGADFKKEIIEEVLRAGSLSVGHDAPAALVGAMAGASGLIVIAGTGSVAYGESSRGRSLRVGGWGYLFGDEGSGFWIASQGVRRAMQAHDGLAAPTSLVNVALEFFRSEDLQALAMAVYRGDVARDQLASFAVAVEAAARAGDAAASRIMEEAGAALATFAVAVAERLALAPDEQRVACAGGVFRSPLVRASFAAALKAALPKAHLVERRFDACLGALMLAYKQAGRDITPDVSRNLDEAMRALVVQQSSSASG